MMHNKQSSQKKGTADYIQEYATAAKKILAESNQLKKIKIAVLSGSTIEGLKEVLFMKCYELGIHSEIFIGGYNQYNQEILDEKSRLYAFKPDLVILSIDTRLLLGDAYFNYYQLSQKEIGKLQEHILQQLESLANKLTQHLHCKVVLHNLQVPTRSPLGILDNKQGLGLIEFVAKLNLEISKQFRENTQVFIFDYESFCSRWGKNNILDYKMYYLGDIQVNLTYLPALCEEYVSYVKALLSLTKKCIVLDLDNTLWGGVIGEDGMEGIQLGPTPEGRPFVEFQKYLLSLFNRGIILAINSRNNPEDAHVVLSKHPHMILREKHFACVRVNWEDKVKNMKEISEELGIGLDSFVFFDDDPFNREMVRSSLPEMTVIDLPQDPSLYLETLMSLNDFASFQFSQEDRRRGQMYAEQRERKQLSDASSTISEYLKALAMVVTIEQADSFAIPRISQLTQKTNQFTMTTKRYSEEDIERMTEDENYMVFSVKVKDKFGDNGITGAVIIKKDGERWVIDSFLLSCRIIGRRVEEAILAYILTGAKKENAATLVGAFIQTKKNAPAKAFYEKNGFKLVEDKEDGQVWEFPVDQEYRYPDFVTIMGTWID